MCGIAACISIKKQIDRKRFDRMTDIIQHRGPNDRGVYFDKNIALGHRRLSIIDLTKDGHQPFEMIDGYVLIFNGEIYNYIELRDELQGKGYKFKTKTDTETIIHAYMEWGEDCVTHFNGMWAFVLYDKNNKKLFCSRDRFGVKPLYYTEQEGMFLLASEIKQFFEMLTQNPKANKELLMQYIVRGLIEYPPYTLFKDIYQLEPGCNLDYDLKTNTFSKVRYYNISDNLESEQTYEEACEQFKEVFTEAVRLRLRSDVTLGYFLSGGLDSSAIVCVADKLVNKSNASEIFKEQHTISSCFEEKEYDEQEYIDEVINATNIIPHKIFPKESDMLEELDKLIWHMDEPVSGPTGFAQWSVCKASKEKNLTVMLDGQGSDEQLAGYMDFYRVLFLYYLKKMQIKNLLREINAYLSLRGQNKASAKIKLILCTFKDLLTPRVFEKLVKRIYVEKVAKLPFDRKTVKVALSKELIYPKRNPRGFIKDYIENELLYQLHQGDRYSMAFSIENRNPFLDYRLVEQIYKMPFEYKIRNGYTKAVLRDGLDGIIPEKIQKRVSKFGFETPGEKWIADNYEYYRDEFIKGLKKFDKLFDTQRVMKWFDDKSNDGAIKDALMWRIIDSSRWVEIFNVKV